MVAVSYANKKLFTSTSKAAFAFLTLYSLSIALIHFQFTGCAIANNDSAKLKEMTHPESQVTRGSVSSEESNLFIKPPLFNPWRDFVFSEVFLLSGTGTPKYLF